MLSYLQGNFRKPHISDPVDYIYTFDREIYFLISFVAHATAPDRQGVRYSRKICFLEDIRGVHWIQICG